MLHTCEVDADKPQVAVHTKEARLNLTVDDGARGAAACGDSDGDAGGDGELRAAESVETAAVARTREEGARPVKLGCVVCGARKIRRGKGQHHPPPRVRAARRYTYGGWRL